MAPETQAPEVSSRERTRVGCVEVAEGIGVPWAREQNATAERTQKEVWA